MTQIKILLYFNQILSAGNCNVSPVTVHQTIHTCGIVDVKDVICNVEKLPAQSGDLCRGNTRVSFDLERKRGKVNSLSH